MEGLVPTSEVDGVRCGVSVVLGRGKDELCLLLEEDDFLCRIESLYSNSTGSKDVLNTASFS